MLKPFESITMLVAHLPDFAAGLLDFGRTARAVVCRAVAWSSANGESVASLQHQGWRLRLARQTRFSTHSLAVIRA